MASRLSVIPRRTLVLSLAICGAALFAAPAPAQVHGVHMGIGSSASTRTGISVRSNGRNGFARPVQRRFNNGSAFIAPWYFYPEYEYEPEPVAPEPAPMRVI